MIYDSSLIEKYFDKFTKDMPTYLPEGAIEVDIDFLERLDLLKLDKSRESALTRYFNILETQDKLTLINDQFIIWIMPGYQDVSNTLVLIALNDEGTPRLELAFITSDVYNSSKLVLRILEKLLLDIQENEDSIKHYSL